jgi:hypothetical protein
MLDVIDTLNSVLPSPALNVKGQDGNTYAEKMVSLLRNNTGQFGTTATPGDRFVNSIVASVEKNQPIQLPTSALEGIKHKGKIIKS